MPQTSHIAAALLALYAATFGLASEFHQWEAAHLLGSVLLAPLLITLSTIDISSYRPPDRLNLLLFTLGGALAGWSGLENLTWKFCAAALGFGALAGVGHIYRRVRKRPGLGLGDAKLFGAAGMWVGLEGLASTLMIACLSALCGTAIAGLAGRRIEATTPIPFGPFLCIGIWSVWCFGPVI
jgi:leader peptidase (prepilin peptidase)/N-methyltransferase